MHQQAEKMTKKKQLKPIHTSNRRRLGVNSGGALFIPSSSPFSLDTNFYFLLWDVVVHIFSNGSTRQVLIAAAATLRVARTDWDLPVCVASLLTPPTCVPLVCYLFLLPRTSVHTHTSPHAEVSKEKSLRGSIRSTR